MKISLRIRIKPLDLDSMDSDELKQKAQKIFDTILQLETDKYDYEQRQLDQVRFYITFTFVYAFMILCFHVILLHFFRIMS